MSSLALILRSEKFTSSVVLICSSVCVNETSLRTWERNFQPVWENDFGDRTEWFRLQLKNNHVSHYGALFSDALTNIYFVTNGELFIARCWSAPLSSLGCFIRTDAVCRLPACLQRNLHNLIWLPNAIMLDLILEGRGWSVNPFSISIKVHGVRGAQVSRQLFPNSTTWPRC